MFTFEVGLFFGCIQYHTMITNEIHCTSFKIIQMINLAWKVILFPFTGLWFLSVCLSSLSFDFSWNLYFIVDHLTFHSRLPRSLEVWNIKLKVILCNFISYHRAVISIHSLCTNCPFYIDITLSHLHAHIQDFI